MTTASEPEPARPWRLEDGPRPKVWTWPRTDRPALWVRSHGAERYAPILAKQQWPDGTVYYQVEIDPHGDRRVGMRLYRWPQPGLRMARVSQSPPARGVDESCQAEMPHRTA
ncbi:hypothetical protein ACIP10_35050 [Streptomyces galbus]|uniref:hypothetical protein n=1 Tax=Streptomyces galbus TaxID=33898 RepID=UPI003819C4AD